MGVLSSALRTEVEAQADLTATFKLGGKDVAVGSKPLTPSDFDYVNGVIAKAASDRKMAYVPFQQDPTDFGGQIALLIRKVRTLDDDGNLTDEKAFDLSDKPMLNRLGVHLISEWFTDLFKDQVTGNPEEQVEDAEGN